MPPKTALRSVHDAHAESNPQRAKRQQALERKRAADRDARRTERRRTKEHIANLEAQVEALLATRDTSMLVDRLLEENAALKKQCDKYERQIRTVKLALSDSPVPLSSESHRSDQNSTDQQLIHPTQQSSAPETTLVDINGAFLDSENSTFQSQADAYPQSSQPLVSSIFSPNSEFTYLPPEWAFQEQEHAITPYMSVLSNMAVYGALGGPNASNNYAIGKDSGLLSNQKIQDFMDDNNLTIFLGDLLPITNEALRKLYKGVSEVLVPLQPRNILNELLNDVTSPNLKAPVSMKTSSIISLLKMSLAEYTVGSLRKAHLRLTEHKRPGQVERIAVFWCMYRLLTWMALPTAADFLRIPPWYRPTQAQLSTSHPGYIDLLVFPLLRERLSYTHSNYDTAKLLGNLSSLFTIVWEPKIWVMTHDVPLISLSETDDWEFQLNPEFERAIWDLKNWRMTPEFLVLYPELADCVNA